MTIRVPRTFPALLAVLCAAAIVPQTHAQRTERFIYAALPGVGGGNNITYGGAGHSGVRHRSRAQVREARAAPGRSAAAAPDAAAGGRGTAQEAIKGIAAHAARRGCTCRPAGALPPTTCSPTSSCGNSVTKGAAPTASRVSPDGKTLYAPVLGAPKWVVADAATGAPIATIDKPGTRTTRVLRRWRARLFRVARRHPDDVGR